MPLSLAQRTAIDEVVSAILEQHVATGRKKRYLSEMFMDLVDKDDWPEYYDVIPQPRCLNGIRDKLKRSGYRSSLDVYQDLQLVFLNAMFYNEEGSQIWNDASTLKDVTETEWKKKSILPVPRDSPPPSSPQKVHAVQTSTAPKTPKKDTKDKDTIVVVSKIRHSPPPPKGKDADQGEDMDVDVDGDGQSQGPDHSEHNEQHTEMYPGMEMQDSAMMLRDAESDEIVRNLERGLPRWDGFSDKGWATDISADRMVEIVVAVKSHKDIIGNRMAAVLDTLPEEPNLPNLSYKELLSLKLIESRARSKSFESVEEFDKSFARLFEKGRRWYEPGSEQYGSVLLLQRLYQALTSPNPPPGPPYVSQTNFAALLAGPGFARPLHAASTSASGPGKSADVDGVPGVTTFRVSSKDRRFVDEVYYKGWTMKLADWLHLANPDDPSRPIICQVFKCWISEEPAKKGQPGVTVCWYYRPEQTYHPAHRQFWENEIFKTGHFADHPLEDIIEKIACQFTARHIRGRPRPPFWYPGWPLYVCDSRYNDRERIFVKIKNWNSCVPEEVRKKADFMPIYPFERTVFPRRFGSPFLSSTLKGAKGARLPGGIGESIERAEGEKIEGGGTGRKRARRNPNAGVGTPGKPHTDEVGPSRGLYVGTAAVATPTAQAQALPYHQQPVTYSPQPAYNAPLQGQSRMPADRTIVTAAGGSTWLKSNGASVEKLLPETAKLFDRDPETNEVLWFSGPPIDVAKAPTPKYSLKYLHYLAMKKKAQQQADATQDDEATSPDTVERPEKRTKVIVPPRATDTFNDLWENFFGKDGPASQNGTT